MHDLAKVTRIQAVRPIEGKDRIELARVENYDSVIQKGSFAPGDRCVYVFYDAILPEREEFEFLRGRCWSEKLKGFRIRPLMLGETVSEGLVLPMSVLPEGEYKDGQVVTELLGIRRYEPPEEPITFMKGQMPLSEKLRRCLLKHGLTGLAQKIPRIRLEYPAPIPRPDEENVEAVWDKVTGYVESWTVTEKVEGQSVCYIYRQGHLEVYSNRRRVFDGAWMKFAVDNRLEKKMRRLCFETGRKGLAIQGELCGPGIQKNVYGFNQLKLFLFGIYELSGQRLSTYRLSDVAARLELDTVPILDECRILPSDIRMVLAGCAGTSKLADVPREGVVWRSNSSERHFKAKNREYKVWFDRK